MMNPRDFHAIRERTQKLVFISGLMLIALLGALVVWWSTRWGAGLSDDSFQYISAARNVAAGRGLTYPLGDGSLTSMVHFPPLYSVLLCGFELFGIDALVGSRWVNVFLFALHLLLLGLILLRATRSMSLSILGSAIVMTSRVLIEVHAWAMSEGLYLLMSLGAIYLLMRYLGNPKPRWLFAMAVVTGAAFLTRYIGFALVLSVGLMILTHDPRPWRGKVKNLGVFSLISLTPMTMWMVRNLILSGAASDRSFAWHPPRHNQLLRGLNTALIWFIPGRFVHGNEIALSFVLFLIGVIALGILLWNRHRRSSAIVSNRPQRWLSTILVIHVLLYMGVLVLSRTFFDPTIPLDDRLLSPVHLSLLIIVILVLQAIIRRRPIYSRVAALIPPLLFLAFYSYRSWQLVLRLHEWGLGYAGRGWHSSPTMEVVRYLDPIPLYSNATAAIYLWSDRTAYPIGDLVEMRSRMRSEGANLVIFDSIPVELYDLSMESLTQGLELLGEYRDGWIYSAVVGR
jgi:hypothetical protein